MSDYLYIGTKPCGCVVAAVVDDGRYAEDTADCVAEFIRDGLIISRILRADLNIKRCRCPHVSAPSPDNAENQMNKEPL